MPKSKAKRDRSKRTDVSAKQARGSQAVSGRATRASTGPTSSAGATPASRATPSTAGMDGLETNAADAGAATSQGGE